jgi:hypothetical protein
MLRPICLWLVPLCKKSGHFTQPGGRYKYAILPMIRITNVQCVL